MPRSHARVLPALVAATLIGSGAAVLGSAATAEAAGSQHRVFASPAACRAILFADAQRLRDQGYTVTISLCTVRGGSLRTDGYLKWH